MNRSKGDKHKPLYLVWYGMKRRCYDAASKSYHLYGGRGVKVCDRWMNFESFCEDVSPRPSPLHKLDRIDNDGNYEPSNVRWATQADQLRNQKRNRMLTYMWQTLCLTDWAALVGMGKCTLRSRLLLLGWDLEKALTTPVRRGYRAKTNRTKHGASTQTA